MPMAQLSPPRISIVIPAYNTEQYLASTVATVAAQTFEDWELTIVDDGATDSTGNLAEQIAASDPRMRVLHKANGGLPNARNAGMRVSNPDVPYIIFLDADDLWQQDTLGSLLAELDQHEEWSGVYSQGQYIDDKNQLLRPGYLEHWAENRLALSQDFRSRVLHPPAAGPTTFEMLALRNYVPSSGAILLRRQDLESAGMFNESLRSAEDWNMWMRLSLHKPIGYVSRVLFQYRRHGTNMSNDNWRMKREQFRAALHVYETCQLTYYQRRLFVHSQSIWIQIYWAREELLRGRPLGALHHLAMIVFNLVNYHLIPKLRRRAAPGSG